MILGVKDDAKAGLINLDQSEAFDRVNHQYQAATPISESGSADSIAVV